MHIWHIKLGFDAQDVRTMPCHINWNRCSLLCTNMHIWHIRLGFHAQDVEAMPHPHAYDLIRCTETSVCLCQLHGCIRGQTFSGALSVCISHSQSLWYSCNSCNPLKLCCDPLGMQQPSLHTMTLKSHPSKLSCWLCVCVHCACVSMRVLSLFWLWRAVCSSLERQHIKEYIIIKSDWLNLNVALPLLNNTGTVQKNDSFNTRRPLFGICCHRMSTSVCLCHLLQLTRKKHLFLTAFPWYLPVCLYALSNVNRHCRLCDGISVTFWFRLAVCQTNQWRSVCQTNQWRSETSLGGAF